MKNYKISAFSLLSLLAMSIGCWSCSTIKVTVDPSNPTVELSDYESFAFFNLDAEEDTTGVLDENMTYFKSEVVRQMNARGLTQDANDPDLKINLGITVEEKTQTRRTSLSDPGEWTYIGQRNYKWESKTVELGTYKEGSVTIHLVDQDSNEAVWVGLIEGIIPSKPEKRQEAIKKAVASLFEKIDE